MDNNLAFDGVLQAGNLEDSYSFTLDEETNVEINGSSFTSATTTDPALGPNFPIPAVRVRFRIAQDFNNNGAIEPGEAIGEPSQLPAGGVFDPVTTFDSNLSAGNYVVELTPTVH